MSAALRHLRAAMRLTAALTAGPIESVREENTLLVATNRELQAAVLELQRGLEIAYRANAELRRKQEEFTAELRQASLSEDCLRVENDALRQEARSTSELLRIVSLTYAIETVA